MRFLIIKSFDHHLSGWHYLSENFKDILKQEYPGANVEIKNIPYTSWYTSSYYFYTYKNIELKQNYDLIFVCEGKPCQKWSKNGKIIWMPCQEFIKGGAWKLIQNKKETWYSILCPSLFAYNKIKENNPKIDHIQFWSDIVSELSWEDIRSKKSRDKLRLLLHFRTRNWGSSFWKKLLRKLNRIQNTEFILKFDNHSDLDISHIRLDNIRGIIGGVLKEKDAYIKALMSSDVYFAPRIIEGIGLCAQEAAQFGNVIVGPDFTTHNEYFNDKNGLIINCEKYHDKYSQFFLGEQQSVVIAKNEQEKIAVFINELANNKKKLRDIQEYNYQYSRIKYHSFKEEFKEYVDKQLNIEVKTDKKPRIGHLQFRLEGGQGLISVLTASDLQETGFYNEFYYITDNDNEKAIKSYIERLDDRSIKNCKTEHPKDLTMNCDILFVHWCSVAKKCPNFQEWYRWIDKLKIPTIGLIYDSVETMPAICDYYCVPSEFNAQFVPCDSKRTFFIPYQIEDCFFETDKDSGYMNFKNSPFVIGRTSRLISRKFHKTFVPICKYLSNMKDGLSVHLVGDGDYKNQIIKNFDKWKIPYNFTSDYKNHRAEVMRTFDICLYLTDEHEESFGLSLAEQMALGTPVVCQNKGALKGIVGDGGIVCDSLHEVIYSCEKLIKDHLFRDEISKKAKEKSKEYTRKNVVLKYHDMIKFVLSDDKRDLELKENPVWSVVMPAYNVEKYILTAVNSVIDQTYDKWELIIVNDGSTDKTYDKIKDLIDNNRIRYIECSDGPHCQAYAWKKGIESARGQYIGFLDSDDWMSSVALKTMNDYYRDHSDVICAWSQNEQWSANMGHKLRTGYSEEPYKYGGLIDGTLKDFPGVMVSHFITCKKEFIPDIDESVLTSADRWLVLQMDLKGKLGFVNNILYRYRYLRSGSITKEKRNLQIKTLENIINNNLFIRNYDKSISLKIEDNCFDYKITQEKTV